MTTKTKKPTKKATNGRAKSRAVLVGNQSYVPEWLNIVLLGQWNERRIAATRRLSAACAPETILALLDALDAAERVQGEAIAHCRASGEPCWCGAHTSSVGDGEATAPLSAFPGHVECGRALEAAERERDQARADLRTYGRHTAACVRGQSGDCTCGYAEALARAEGR